MTILAAALLSFMLVGMSTFIHYEALRTLNIWLSRLRLAHPEAKVLLAVLGALMSHACHIFFFASFYYLLRESFGSGLLGTHFRNDFPSYLYFSTETYTSLGFGDIFPLGPLRMLVGVEALTGLLMISWTASFTYLEMSRYWRGS